MKKVFNVIIGILLIAAITLLVLSRIQYNNSISDYNDLMSDYNDLVDENNFNVSIYNNLYKDYEDLQTQYEDLQDEYEELEEKYIAETEVIYETPTDLSQYATDISYEDIARTPDDYEGMALCYKGEVIQVLESDGETDLRIALDDWYEDILLCGYDPKITDKRVLEGDTVTVYGIYYGIFIYESALGTDVSLPLLWVEHIEIN